MRDLTLSVNRGEVFGFLGPNGAGKTTSIKMLLNLIAPTGGQAILFGYPASNPDIRARVGFLPEHFRFHDWLTAEEFLTLHADLYRLRREIARPRINELLELVGLAPHRGKKLREFSKGMLQRIGLAQALLNQPELVILDEPTSGLDPISTTKVEASLQELKQSYTIILVPHSVQQAARTADQAAFFLQGQLIEYAPGKSIFITPQDKRTEDYVEGRFG